MKKKLVILLIIVALVFMGIWAYEFMLGKKVTNENISERSREFIQSQKQGSLLDDPNKNSGPSTVGKADCFSFTIPWSVSIEREDGPCDWHYLTEKPKLNINVYTREISVTTLDEEPGIKLRRDRTTTYAESKIKSNGREFIIFHKKSGAYEINAFYLNRNKLFVLNILSYSSENLDEALKKILESVELPS